MERIKVSKEDIGKTIVFCGVCDYKKVVGSVAVSANCPKCRGVLDFIDITQEFFNDEE